MAGKRLFQGQFSVAYVTLMIIRWGKGGGHIGRQGGKRRRVVIVLERRDRGGSGYR